MYITAVHEFCEILAIAGQAQAENFLNHRAKLTVPYHGLESHGSAVKNIRQSTNVSTSLNLES